jgi:hypothetical protein
VSLDDLDVGPKRGDCKPEGLAGGLVRGLTAALAVALIAAPFAGGLERPAIAVFSLALTGLVFSALGVITGVWADTFDQHSFIASVVITPLALLGGVFYSARTLEEPWNTPIGDPVIGLLITLVIVKITWDSWRTVSTTEPGELVDPDDH